MFLINSLLICLALSIKVVTSSHVNTTISFRVNFGDFVKRTTFRNTSPSRTASSTHIAKYLLAARTVEGDKALPSAHPLINGEFKCFCKLDASNAAGLRFSNFGTM